MEGTHLLQHLLAGEVSGVGEHAGDSGQPRHLFSHATAFLQELAVLCVQIGGLKAPDRSAC